ncbi:hypothetical protein HDU67_009996 [Dinochytrium kinnereticum]|nr:hypothetical protein HDU67_009996 [Dinochytrium kinnereticum]
MATGQVERLLLYEEMMGVVYESDPLQVAMAYFEKNQNVQCDLACVSDVGWDPIAQSLASVEMMESFGVLNKHQTKPCLFGFYEDEWKELVHVSNSEVKNLPHVWTKEIQTNRNLKKELLEADLAVSSELYEYLEMLAGVNRVHVGACRWSVRAETSSFVIETVSLFYVFYQHLVNAWEENGDSRRRATNAVLQQQ